MDVLELIDQARGAGLTILPDSGKLIVRGPSSAAPLARALGRHKAAVLAALLEPTPPPTITETPTNTGESEGFGYGHAQESLKNASEALEEIDCLPACPKCQSLELWQTCLGNWRCQSCDPPVRGMKLLEQAQRIRNKAKRKGR